MNKKDPNLAQEAQKYDNPIPSREYILQQLEKHNARLAFMEIAQLLDLDSDQELYALKKRLRAMRRDGQIQQDQRSRYFIAAPEKTFCGTVLGHRDGYGFLRPEEGGDDSYINPHEMRAVFHGDKVLARVIGHDRKGNSEITIVDVLERAHQEVIGRVVIEDKHMLVAPHNKNITQDIIVTNKNTTDFSVGDVVTVKIIEQPSRYAKPKGEIIEKLGDHLTPGLEIDIAIRMHALPFKWPKQVLKENEAIAQSLSSKDIKGRKDFRALPFVTIDGEDAKDFDDAVYCSPLPSGGFKLYVAIADVSHYVKQNTALDEEALLRGNSAYFPGKVVPMLPEKLSNGLCSLNPKVDRLVMVCEMTLSKEGRVNRYQFHEGVIHSHARMTYTKVQGILHGDKTLSKEYHELLPLFFNLQAAYHLLNQQRQARGAIEFETVETKILFNEQGKIRQIVPTERNDAHKIIEELMLAANVCAAKFIMKSKKGEVYRIHEGPNQDKLPDLQKTLAELGLHLPGGEEVRPQHYAKLLKQIQHRPDSAMLNTLLLRSLTQAVYGIEQIGHFGLAFDIYTHFTSPIRRYPDLMVHRIIRAIVRGNKRRVYSDERLQQLTSHCSTTERRADLASRDAMDMLKCDFMKDKVGETLTGSITSVTQFGLFVTLHEYYVEGLVHISSLAQDYYIYDPINQALVAERSGQRYRLGDDVTILVARVDVHQKQIDFTLPNSSKDAKKALKKPKKKSKYKKSKAKKKGKSKR